MCLVQNNLLLPPQMKFRELSQGDRVYISVTETPGQRSPGQTPSPATVVDGTHPNRMHTSLANSSYNSSRLINRRCEWFLIILVLLGIIYQENLIYSCLSQYIYLYLSICHYLCLDLSLSLPWFICVFVFHWD